MYEFEAEDFEKTDCPYCALFVLVANLDSCLVCRKVERACPACLAKHRATHTEAEIEAFRQDLEGEDYLTPRERINDELKRQIMTLAEILCKALDDREDVCKKYENQCRVLAAEVDRLTPVS